MTYITGGNIQASDYNTFATSAQSVNEVFADLHSGATTVASGADFGYGQTPALSSVAIGNTITAAQWTTLFTAMKECGEHQGTPVVPPLPGTGSYAVTMPVTGNIITSYNTNVSPVAVNTLLTNLRNNRLNLALGQTAQTNVNSSGTSAPWTNTLSYTFSVNLGTWNQARYFFNSGGWIGISGSYPGSGQPTTTDDYQWWNFLNQLGSIQLKAKSTTANLSNQAALTHGLWNNSTGNPLTTTYQTVYQRAYGGAGYYSGSSVILEARLGAAAGAAGSGTIQFRITLTQVDSSVPSDTKPLATTFTLIETHSTGAIAWTGSATITPGSFTLT